MISKQHLKNIFLVKKLNGNLLILINSKILIILFLKKRNKRGHILEQKSDKFRETFEKSPIGIIFCDKEGKFTDVNPAALKIMGFLSISNLIGLNIFDDPYINPKKDELLKKGFIEIQAPFNFDYYKKEDIYNPTRSGTAFLDLTLSVINSGFLMQIQDITERKKGEGSEERLKALMDNNPSLIFMKDESGKYVYLNKTYEKQFINSKDWYGKTDFDFWPKESAELFRANDAEVLKSEMIHQFLEDSNDLDGRRYVWLNYKFPFIDSKNKRYVGGIGIDATDRVVVEENLKEREEQLRSIMDNSLDAIYRRNLLTGHYEYFSHAIEQITGFSLEEILIMNQDDVLEHVHPDDLQNVISEKIEVASNFTQGTVDYRFLCKDNKHKWLSDRFRIIYNEEGVAVFREGIIRDIDESKKVEEALKEVRDNLELKVEERTAEIEETYVTLKENELKLKDAIDELKRSNQELQSFAYITSHDLQEPLRNIASFAQLLKRRYKGKLDSDADDFIDFMVDGATRMKGMIQGLLEYSRINRETESVEVDMNEMVERATSNLQLIVDGSKTEITHEDLPIVNSDPNQMVRVFQNLIGNAIKFKKPQFPPRIHISAQRKDNEYIFSVEDNGIGIESEYADQIFEVFKRLHTVDEYEGTGIGLSIVRKIIESNGGRIWVESELGVGSTFYFIIPIKNQKATLNNDILKKKGCIF